MSILYAVASLPSLVMEEAPPTTAEEFHFHMTGVLSEPDRAELRLLIESRPEEGGSMFNRRWAGIETQLRNEIARVRGKRIGAESSPYLRRHEFIDVRIEPLVVDAFAKSNPLERERVLDEGRWSLLDDLVAEDPYGLTAVLAHAVKLGIAERWASLDRGQGEEKLEELMNTIVESAQEATP